MFNTQIARIVSLLILLVGGLLSAISWYGQVSFADNIYDQLVIIAFIIALSYLGGVAIRRIPFRIHKK